MLSWLEQKPGQKNERQKNGVWHHPWPAAGRAKQCSLWGNEQTTNIFLSSIFLSSECFCGMPALTQARDSAIRPLNCKKIEDGHG